MRKLVYLFASVLLTVSSLFFVVGTPAFAAAEGVAAGKTIYLNGGKRLGAIYKTTSNGSAQVILDGKLVTIPADTITVENGKVQTSLTKQELKGR